MMLAVQIFLIVLLAQVIGWIGKTRLNALAYTLFLSITRSPLQRRFVALRKELFKTKADLQSTSSQDEFAKWARLRRKMDKETAELEKLNAEIASARAKFSATFSSLIWLATTGLQFVVVSWNRSTPVFYLPPGWFPHPVAWIFGLPSAPLGALSTTVWAMACQRVLTLTSGSLSGLAARQPKVVAAT